MSKLEPKENQLVVVDGDGNEILCEILFTFQSERTGKNFVIFYRVEDLSTDDEGLDLSAAIYVEAENDSTGELIEIEDDEDWNEVEDAINDFEQRYGEELGSEEE